MHDRLEVGAPYLGDPEHCVSLEPQSPSSLIRPNCCLTLLL